MEWYQNDPIMAGLVKDLPAPVSRKSDDLYLSLLDSVMGQQLSTKAADAIFARFVKLFDNDYPQADQILSMEDAVLRSAGLSGAKVRYVKNIAAFHQSKPITVQRLNAMLDVDILADLTQIKGVGAWTVQMLLMFAMDRPDVFSIGDLVIRQTMVNLYHLTGTQAEQMRAMENIAVKWAPHRTLGCKYLWAARGAKLA